MQHNTGTAGPPASSGRGPIRVLCVDDSPDVIRMLQITIGREADLECTGALSSADHLIEKATADQPDVVLLDLTMPGRDPLEAVAEMARSMPDIRVLVFSGFDDQAHVDAVFQAGAWGLVSKNAEISAILAAIRQVAAGGVVHP